jgi:IMP dehydrogenase
VKIVDDTSRTLGEYLLVPNLTTSECSPSNIELTTSLVKHRVGEASSIQLAVPLTSAIMQAISSPKMAISIAQTGGISFIHHNQSIESQTNMVSSVKRHKAGFRYSEINARMQHVDELVTASPSISLSEANSLLWDRRLDVLPIVTDEGNLDSIVLRRDYELHKTFRNETIDDGKRFRVGAGVNTHDYKERIPALLAAGADVLCIDSSDGYSVWQKETIEFAKSQGEGALIGAGNVVDGRAFRYLAEAGADFVKVGIGGGSICITRDQKGIGRGQASALLDVVRERDLYAEETGFYVPICCDGGVLNDFHMAIAFALGADFMMLGRYFARFDESPSRPVRMNGQFYKEYWGEGSRRARNWSRYDQGNGDEMVFEEGVDGYVPYAGSLYDNVSMTLAKLKATLASCGSTTLRQFHENAVLVQVSHQSYLQNVHEVELRNLPHDPGT